MATLMPALSAVRDFEVTSPPDDSISCLNFSPSTIQQIYLIAGSWDNSVRCWEVERSSGKTDPKALKSMSGPILDVCWNDDASKVFMASCDKTANCWDLASNSTIQVAQHDAPVKTCHWIKAPNYTALMTSSWDKTIKFWDTRQSNPMLTINLPERCYCVDVDFPLAVVGTASKELITYKLDNTPAEFKRTNSLIKHQLRCVSISRNKQNTPDGYIYGSSEGRIAMEYINPADQSKDNYNFKAHRSTKTKSDAQGFQDIYAINDVKFHPTHGTLASVGSDGGYCYWDKNARSKLKTSELMDQPITCCAFNSDGQIFAYALSYDWSKGHSYNNPLKKNQIFLHPCFEELKPKPKT